MKTNDVLEGIVRVDDEAGPHPSEEWGPGEHSAALGWPGRHVPGVATLSDHQDELVTPANRENVFNVLCIKEKISRAVNRKWRRFQSSAKHLKHIK